MMKLRRYDHFRAILYIYMYLCNIVIVNQSSLGAYSSISVVVVDPSDTSSISSVKPLIHAMNGSFWDLDKFCSSISEVWNRIPSNLQPVLDKVGRCLAFLFFNNLYLINGSMNNPCFSILKPHIYTFSIKLIFQSAICRKESMLEEFLPIFLKG